MQIISFVDILLTHTVARSVLCIVPINTIQNWMAEFNFWLPAEEEEVTDHVSYHINCTKIITIVLAYNRLRKRLFLLLNCTNSHKNIVQGREEDHERKIKHRNFSIYVLNDTYKNLNQRASVISEWGKTGGKESIVCEDLKLQIIFFFYRSSYDGI